MREIPIGDLPLYSYDYDADYPPAGTRAEGRDRRGRRRAVRDARVQPLDPRRAQERDRLGEPPVGQELLRAQAVGDHRHVARARSARRSASSTSGASWPSATRR